jgi:hypothetical protein
LRHYRVHQQEIVGIGVPDDPDIPIWIYRRRLWSIVALPAKQRSVESRHAQRRQSDPTPPTLLAAAGEGATLAGPRGPLRQW